MELFAPLFPVRETKKLVKPLKRLQDNLGLFNDYSVQQERLGDVLRRMEEAPDAGDIEIAQSVGALVAVLHRLQREERAKVMASFETFNSRDTCQVFRSLFKKGKSPA